MPSWNELLAETKSASNVYDTLRRKYLSEIREITKRNVIAYYSGWLQKSGNPALSSDVIAQISDDDKNGFMNAVHKLDRKLGLDIILHTPGGDLASTESLVDYLRSMFGTNIRAIVPQLAMSAGTMIACACRSIIMGKHSSLGPIDPQFAGIPAHGVVEEFKRAKKEIEESPGAIPVWQPIIANYRPTLIGDCEKAIAWSNEITEEWLKTGMFVNNGSAAQEGANTEDIIKTILDELGDHALTKSHNRHLSAGRCRRMGLKIENLEDDQKLQDAVLSYHHACVLTFASTHACKIIENHDGIAFVKIVNPLVVNQPIIASQEPE